MKAWRYVDNFGLENLRLVELPDPEPGPGQAVVRIRACSLNYRDLVVSKGGYGKAVRPGITPLSDGAGEVVAVGPGVTRVKQGDKVAACFMPKWIDGEVDDAGANSALGGQASGVLAEQILIDAEGLVKFPEGYSFEEAATLPCAAVTAWNCLFVSGNLQPGQTVLVQGSGGVSVFALQLAKMAGARVIATSSSDEKLTRLEDLGADAGVNYKTFPEWDAPVRRAAPFGVDHIVEVGGAGTLPLSFKTVRRGGHIALIGVLAGAGQIDPRMIFAKSIKVQGVMVGSRAMFEAMNRALLIGGIRPVIDRTFAFDEIHQAMAYMESGAHFGKICIAGA